MCKTESKGKRMRKVSRLAVITNTVQIVCALLILFYALFSESFHLPEQAEIAVTALACGVLIWGGVVDIRDALIMRRIEMQNRMLEEAYRQLEKLNTTLRKQRHDFKNHLQVIYTLTEMKAYGDVQDYVQRIYEDVQVVSNLMRTSVPAVNALLSAKSADCSDRGIRFDVDIQSSWADIPVPGWELCRIIGNLVDNAMDALEEGNTPQPRISVTIGESIQSWSLTVENNGPEIAHEHKKSILLPGFTTKSSGHGNGLSIVSDLMEEYGGSLSFDSNPDATRFVCVFPRKDVHSDAAQL